MTAPSDRQQLVQARFDAQGVGPVGAWIDQQRAAGKSWAAISFALRDLVGLEVSYETLRRWHQDHAVEAGTSADTD
jgi:hypothetical protein